MSRIIRTGVLRDAVRSFPAGKIFGDLTPNKKREQARIFQMTSFEGSTDTGEDRGEDAKKLIEEAKEKAEKYLKEAKKKASNIEREAYEKAFVQGEKAGMEIGKKKAEPIIDSFYEIIEELSTFREKICDESENELVKLALAISRGIIHQELTLNQEVVINNVKAALKNAIGVGGIKIRVSPLDIEFIRECKPQILESIEGSANIVLEEDRGIIRGGCIVETDFGDIDARIESQIEELDRVLRSSLRDLEG